MGAVAAVVLAAAAGAASGQEATPLWPDIGAVGAPATIDAPPVPDAEPDAPASEQHATAQVKPAVVQTTTVGSRLLRALAESSGRDDHAAERALPALVARGSAAGACPRTLLHRLLAGAAGEADALAALAIETEILTLCSERQRIVTALFETEARLKELRAPAEPVPVIEAARIAPPAPAVPEMERETHVKPAPDTGALAAGTAAVTGRIEAGALMTAGTLDAAALSAAGTATVEGPAAAREIAGERLAVSGTVGGSTTAAGEVYGPDAHIPGLLTVGSCAGCEGE